MTDAPAAPAAPAETAAPKTFGGFLRRLVHGDLELLIVFMLGIVSVATAYASFQSALYDSQMAGAYTRGQNAQTEAESLYLEANQQYIQDVQTWARLTELTTDMDSADPVLATAASAKFDSIYFVSVGRGLRGGDHLVAGAERRRPGQLHEPVRLRGLPERAVRRLGRGGRPAARRSSRRATCTTATATG